MVTSSFRHLRLGWVFAIAVCLLLAWQARNSLSGAPILADASQSLTMAYNLYVNGTLSLATKAPFTPTNLREPLPPMAAALFLALHRDVHPGMSLESFFQGENAYLLKQVNVFWSLAGLFGSWVLTYMVCRSHRVALLAVLCGYLFFFGAREFVDSLYTELPAAVVIVWAAVALVWLERRDALAASAFAGFLFGMLALTKAIFLYVSVGIGLLMILYYTLVRCDLKVSRRWGSILLFFSVFLVVVGFWAIRNKLVLDRFELTQRAGVVLLVRAFKNEMSREEVIGAYWYWGPHLYKRLVKGSALDATDADFSIGGRFHRLNRTSLVGDLEAEEAGKPEDAVSFYHQARAWRKREMLRFAALEAKDSIQSPYVLAEREAMDRAARMIAAAPGAHLAKTPLFLWRGIWCFPSVRLPYNAGGYQRYLIDSVNAVAYLSLFGLFAFGFARRRYDLAAMTVVPLGMLASYCLFSHDIPRYSAPVIPVMLISLVVIVSGRLTARANRDGGEGGHDRSERVRAVPVASQGVNEGFCSSTGASNQGRTK